MLNSNKLRPFFSFYGGKWRSAPKYPKPAHTTIIEPFAGSAGYSLRYPDNDVVLIERDPVVVQTWEYLLCVRETEILQLPDVGLDQSVDDLHIYEEAKTLIGWWLNKGSAQPKLTPSSNMGKSMRGERPKDPPSGWWGSAIRARIAAQLGHIRHWKIIEGDYSAAPDVEATWFIDPPYIAAGKYYTDGPSLLDYETLGGWCQSRVGQVMVCENVGAAWLPFEPWRDVKSNESKNGGKVSREALWTNSFKEVPDAVEV